MRSSLLALSSLILLTACPEEIVMGPPATTEPAPAPVKLHSGEYSVLITGITNLDCDGVRGQDLAGLKLPLSLQVHAHQAAASFAGFELEGERHSGVLTLTGSLGDDPVVQSEEDEQYPDEDEQVDEQGEDESSGGSTASEESEESEDIDSEDSESGDVDVAQMEELVSLELVEQSTTHAEGRMFFSAGACSFEVPVSAHRISGGGEEKPVPVEEGEETESGCDDGAEDCG